MGSFFTLLFIISVIAFFFWQKMLDLFLSFLPENVNISGEIVDVFTKLVFVPFFTSVDNSFIALDISRGVPIDFYYVKIWDLKKDEYNVVGVDFLMYEDMKKRLDNLDVDISLPCKKDPFTGELYA